MTVHVQYSTVTMTGRKDLVGMYKWRREERWSGECMSMGQ